MRISRIALKNFRNFADLSVSFENDPHLAAITGKNSSGKTGILDAIALALESYLAGFSPEGGDRSGGLCDEDVRLQMISSGGGTVVEKQYPAVIVATACVHDATGDDQPVTWQSQILAPDSGEQQIPQISPIRERAASLRHLIVHSRETQVILPVVAYYRTGRLCRHNPEKGPFFEGGSTSDRLQSYSGCLNASLDEESFLAWFREMSLSEEEKMSLPLLHAVSNAMVRCCAGIPVQEDHAPGAAPWIRYMKDTGEVEIVCSRDGGEMRMPFRMLGGGSKAAALLAADIACRMIRLNPSLGDAATRETCGVVLIDEIEQHLHPEAQKSILEDLRELFPKVQFIVTTNSPFVVTNIESGNIVSIAGRNAYSPNCIVFGRDADNLLDVLMDTDVRPDKIADLEEKFYDSVDDELRDRAEKYLCDLKELLDEEHPVYIKARIAFDLNFDLGEDRE